MIIKVVRLSWAGGSPSIGELAQFLEEAREIAGVEELVTMYGDELIVSDDT